MPEQYLVFTCCNANASTSANTRKKEKTLALVSLRVFLCLRQGRFHGEIKFIVLTLVLALLLASLVKTMLKYKFTPLASVTC